MATSDITILNIFESLSLTDNNKFNVNLPTEIWSVVVEDDSLSIPDLKNIRLVSRTFSSICTPLMFREITIRPSKSSVDRFIEITNSMARYVQKLTVISTKLYFDGDYQGPWKSPDDACHEKLYEAIHKCGRITSLEVTLESTSQSDPNPWPPTERHCDPKLVLSILCNLAENVRLTHLKIYPLISISPTNSGMASIDYTKPLRHLESLTSLELIGSGRWTTELGYDMTSQPIPLLEHLWSQAKNIRHLAISANEDAIYHPEALITLHPHFWTSHFPHLLELHLNQVFIPPNTLPHFCAAHTATLRNIEIRNIALPGDEEDGMEVVESLTSHLDAMEDYYNDEDDVDVDDDSDDGGYWWDDCSITQHKDLPAATISIEYH